MKKPPKAKSPKVDIVTLDGICTMEEFRVIRALESAGFDGKSIERITRLDPVACDLIRSPSRWGELIICRMPT